VANVRRRRGEQAERLAALHLESCGVRIIARNFRWRGGELDLVGVAGDLLLFVEVRQRTRADFGGGLVSVDFRKRLRLRRAAEYFRLRRPEWRAHRARFDVLALEGDVLAPKGDLPAPKGDLPAPKGDLPAPKGDLPAPKGDLLAREGAGGTAAHLVWVQNAFI
jgi:putative endonuclease